MRENPAHLKQLEDWLRSYQPEELFDETGRLMPELKALAPKGARRMSANPHANGGLLRKPLRMPDFRDYAVKVDEARADIGRKHASLGPLPARHHAEQHDRTSACSGPTKPLPTSSMPSTRPARKLWLADYLPEDADGGELAPDGRVMEMLSEHTLEGWLEGYLLTGRHGFFSTYEAFRARD